MKRKMELCEAIDRVDGLSQCAFEINYIYVHDDTLNVFTKQGNSVSIDITKEMQSTLESIEDAVKHKLENP